MLLITIGVVRLRRIDVSTQYHKVITFVVVVAIISCVDAIQELNITEVARMTLV